MGLLVKTCLVLLATIVFVDAQCPYMPTCGECTRDEAGKVFCTRCHNMYGLDTSVSPPDCVECKSRNSGCNLCTDITRCDTCVNLNEGPDDNGLGTCSPCPENCLRCPNSSSTCDPLSCKEGSLFVSGKCQPCPTSCRKCSDTHTCSACQGGFFMDSAGVCTRCIENCDYCKDTKTCIRCVYGYYPSSDRTQCLKCTIDNCKICSDAYTCDVCVDGYYAPNHHKCISCPKNCAKCTGNGKCLRCKSGELSDDGSCTCALHCSTCNQIGEGKCDTCKANFKKNADRTCDPVGSS